MQMCFLFLFFFKSIRVYLYLDVQVLKSPLCKPINGKLWELFKLHIVSLNYNLNRVSRNLQSAFALFAWLKLKSIW